MFKTKIAALAFPALLLGSTAYAAQPAADEDHISVKMVAANPCLPDAKAKVEITPMAPPRTCSLSRAACRPIPVSISS